MFIPKKAVGLHEKYYSPIKYKINENDSRL